MDTKFFQNKIEETDTSFIYDKRKSFEPTEPSDWD